MKNKYYKCGLALQVLSVGHGKGQFLLDRRLMDHHPLAHSGELQYYAVQHKLRSHCALFERIFIFRNMTKFNSNARKIKRRKRKRVDLIDNLNNTSIPPDSPTIETTERRKTKQAEKRRRKSSTS